MGRGRAKAKQTKVARELKYSTGNTDLTALQRELAGAPAPVRTAPVEVEPEDDEYVDPYADLYGDEEEDADDAPPSAAAR